MSVHTENRAPLAGVRVLELSSFAAAVTGRVLADLGADVLKVEPPGGERARATPPLARLAGGQEVSWYWLAFNASKRSVCIDLASPSGRAQFLDEAQAADIIVTDQGRLTTAERDDLAAAVAQQNPAAIWTEVLAFGRGAPDEDYPAGELVLQALGGHLCLNGEPDRPPVWIGLPVAHMQGGAEAASAALMAYYHRLRTGKGQRVDVSIQECVTWTMLNTVMTWQLAGRNEERGGAIRRERMNNYFTRLVWECADGYVALSPIGGGGGSVRAKSFRALVAWMAEDGVDDALLTSRNWTGKDAGVTQEDYDAVAALIGAFVRTKTKKQLMDRGVRDSILLAPINGVGDILGSDHFRERGLFQRLRLEGWGGVEVDYPAKWVNFSRTPLRPVFTPPAVPAQTQLPAASFEGA